MRIGEVLQLLRESKKGISMTVMTGKELEGRLRAANTHARLGMYVYARDPALVLKTVE